MTLPYLCLVQPLPYGYIRVVQTNLITPEWFLFKAGAGYIDFP